MLEINCIKLIFSYLYPNTFPKIQQKLGGQLEIRLSVDMEFQVPISRPKHGKMELLLSQYTRVYRVYFTVTVYLCNVSIYDHYSCVE